MSNAQRIRMKSPARFIRVEVQMEIVDFESLEDTPDWSTEPENVLRAKSMRLAEFLGCTEDEAERLILERV